MLQIYVEGSEFYNENTNEFHMVHGARLNLEHSLVSISKWEAKWCKPFFIDNGKTDAELLDYIKCMTINSNQVDDLLYSCLSKKNYDAIRDYISAPMTATTFTSHSNARPARKEVVTSELIYYWMIAYNIPFECEKWHINRLLTLIRICGIKNSPKKKMSKRDTINYYKNLNEQRKASLGTRG